MDTLLVVIFAVYFVHYNLVGSTPRICVCLKAQLAIALFASPYDIFNGIGLPVPGVPISFLFSRKVDSFANKMILTLRFPYFTSRLVCYCGRNAIETVWRHSYTLT